jgi:apolipoprotein N-acyltransferase
MPTTYLPRTTSKLGRWLYFILALLSGSLLPLAFAPFNIQILAILCPAVLLFLWDKASPRQAFWGGWLFGIGFIGIGLSWVYISLHVYGQANPWLAGLITVLMILFLALQIAVQGYIFTRFFPNPNLSKYLLAFPCLWVIMEFVRAWALTGFPWLFLGYSQIHWPLQGLAPILSVYGVSLATAFTSGVIVSLIYLKNKFRQKIVAILLTLIIWIGSYALHTISWTTSSGNPVKVSLIQGNIPQELKWQPSQVTDSLNTYSKLTEQHIDSQIIVWPEAAITLLPNEAKDYLTGLQQFLKRNETTLLTGIPVTKDGYAYNGMLALGNGSGNYRKRHLVPFGEYMPFRFILDWLNAYLQIPMSDFSSGPHHQPLIYANGVPIAAYICYEIGYPTEVLDNLPQGQLLVTISDDSWFGDSLALPQHLQIAQMRALETGRYLLMSTNNGLTAIINSKGKIIASIPPFTQGVLTGTVYARTGATPWVAFGILPLLGIIVLLLTTAWILQRRMLTLCRIHSPSL